MASEQFVEYDDQTEPFTDYVIGTQAREMAVEYVLSFDQDVETSGLTTLPYRGRRAPRFEGREGAGGRLRQHCPQ